MSFELRKASRKLAKIKLGLFGPSGSGKTMGALKVAHGLCTDWSKIAVIDTENRSSDLYAHLGDYQVLELTPPYNPERYIEAIHTCQQAGMEVIIIDSISHEWDGIGGCLDIVDQMQGNSFANWGKVTPRHNAFIQAIVQTDLHIICCGRAKQDYQISDKNGKKVPEKLGLKAITREGFDYELTLCFDIDIKHQANSSKDRTSLFIDKPSVMLDEQIGKQILAWCQMGEDPLVHFELTTQIKKEMLAKNIDAFLVPEILGHNKSSKDMSVDELREALAKFQAYVPQPQPEPEQQAFDENDIAQPSSYLTMPPVQQAGLFNQPQEVA